MRLPDPHRRRRYLGLAFYFAGIVVGAVLLFALFLVPPLFSPDAPRIYGTMVLGAVLAFPAALVYLTVPRLLDRYDPEPWYALVGCLGWGAIAACGISAAVNSAVGVVGAELGGAQAGELLGAVVSAPLIEELTKGIGVLGVFYFLRREFDGVVDGIIYATFTALGFAAVENVVYYSQAAMQGEGILAVTFIMRGILAPWGHPLYTAMTGIGIGVARETTVPWLRWVAPLAGYGGAVLLHAVWNGSAMLASGLFCLTLPLWLLFVVAFLGLVITLVYRRGKIIRLHLEDEVAIGNIDAGELELVVRPFGLAHARLRHGPEAAAFVRACARLALSKWHATRAKRVDTSTVSLQFIAPLRAEVARLRRSLAQGGSRGS
jgi:RsiW-degrading membrane proteinase PrsW (M82 family)